MLNKILKKNASLITKRPKAVLVAAAIITILAGIFASSLSMELNWVILAPEGSPSVQEYEEIIEDFPTLNSIIVLVESDDRQMLEKVALETQLKVSQVERYVTSVVAGVDKDFMLKNAMVYLSDEELEMMGYIFADANVDRMYEFMYMNLDETIKAIKQGNITDEQLQYSVATFDAMKSLLLSTKSALEGHEESEQMLSALESFFVGSSSATSSDGKMTMLTIQPNFDMMDMVNIVPGVNAIEAVIKDMDAKYDNVSVRATGMHIVARDETASIKSDSYLTSILSVLLILFVLYFAFRSWVAPAFAFIPLALGIVWSMGIIGITIGRLNMMTVFSVAMLLGLGIDYAIHMYSSYTEKRSYGLDKAKSIEYAITKTGPSIIVGALTTAIAFFSLNISTLKILTELGTVMGLGIITTLFSVFWVLPALILLKKEKDTKMKKIKGTYPFIGQAAKTVSKARYIVLAIIVLGAVFMGFQAKKVKFDMNLMNLEPEGLESIELMEYMVEKYDTSSDSFALQVDSLDEVYRLHEAYMELDNVAEVVSIASVIPKESIQKQKLKTINDIKEALEYKLPVRTVDKQTLKAIVKELETKLKIYETTWVDADLAILHDEDFASALAAVHDLELLLDTDISNEELETLSKIVYESMDIIENAMLKGELLQVKDLPPEYKSQFISSNGEKFMISVYPDFDIWSNQGTEKGDAFLASIAEIDSSITGTPIFMNDLFNAVSQEILVTGTVLLSILLLILLLHFRSIKYALVAFLPLVFTLIYMVGTMTLLGLDFNMLNFLSVLLIIGIGLDDGVHVLHHYKQGQRDIKKLFSSIGRAILLTTITTVCGFGSLGFSSYRGISGLGIILAIGVSYAFIFTVVVLPIFLKDKSSMESKVKQQ